MGRRRRVVRSSAWRACMGLLPPGGHLAAFGGARTYHRLACAVEDAGFEIRDQLMWLYDSGVPKSRDVAKDIAASGGVEGVAMRQAVADAINASGMTDRGLARALDRSNNLVKYWRQGIRNITPEDAVRVFGLLGVEVPRIERGETPDWSGWGTALKPAHEPIVLARKPLGVGSVANCVLEHGTGALNVGGCKVGDRWPANVAHDGSGEVMVLLGDASRFFYCAKASKAERAGSDHTTVKPLALVRWLVRMVTPPGGTVLDPFAGTGTTGEAALLEGMSAVLVEREADYQEDLLRRMEAVA